MAWIYIAVALIGSTALWPVNRWVMREGGRADTYGFWLSLFGSTVAIVAAFVAGEPWQVPALWGIGGVIGFAYAVGFCLIIMYCLRIGPTGPTAAMNNMGMLWPVVLGATWLTPHALPPITLVGVGLIIAAMVAFSMSKPDGHPASTGPGFSPKWMLWALAGWVLSGVSMTAQLAGSLHAPRSPFALVGIFMGTAALLLVPLVIRRGRTWWRRQEVIGGAINGAINVMVVYSTLSALQTLGAELVFPFTVAGPIILVLLLGQWVYRERLDRAGVFAAVFGVLGLLGLSMQ